jgi:phospholipase/carboxylesterase
VALSGYLPLHESLPAEASAANHQAALMLAHGAHDNVVPYRLGQDTADILRAAGYDVDWHTYEMAHQVCLEEVLEIGRFLTRVLTSVDGPPQSAVAVASESSE